MQAYQLMHEQSHYPLHLGVTEAGTTHMGTLKSAAGIGGLLALGIGDTLRVTLTADPVEEIYAAREKNELGISSRDLAAQIPGAVYCSTLEQVTEELARLAQPGDMIITVGAGDIYRAGEMLLNRGDAE